MESRTIVLAMHNDGKGYCKISKKLKLPKSIVKSIIKKVKDVGHLENLTRNKGPLKVSSIGMLRVSRSIVRNILHKDNLRGCRLRKAPLLRSMHLKSRLMFANIYSP